MQEDKTKKRHAGRQKRKDEKRKVEKTTCRTTKRKNDMQDDNKRKVEKMTKSDLICSFFAIFLGGGELKDDNTIFSDLDISSICRIH